MMRSAPRTVRSVATALLLPVLLCLGTGAAALPEGDTVTITPLKPLDVHARTSVNIIEQLARHHYVRRKIDDDLSSDVFDHYLETLDPQRSYFTADDIKGFEKYRYLLDDALRKGDLDPAFEIFNSYEAHLVDRLEYTIGLLEKGFDGWDFDKKETLEIDRSKEPWLQTSAQMDDLWRKRLKAAVVAMLLNDKALPEIRELLLKRYRNRLHRAAQTNSEDAFQAYMNSVTAAFDPHTQYFSPRTSENFNINMSLSLEGIGAVLRTEDEYTSVVRLVPAGPASKSKLLSPSDRIVAVSQGDSGEWTDVVGWRLDDVVDLIRGPAGSKVNLEILPPGKDSTTHRIALTREAVKLEEQSAKSRVLNVERNGTTHRIGVIDIPTFYIDFKALQEGDPDYKSTTRDVHRLIDELKKQHIEGLVIDLRNDGGGSLQEANSLTGLFIKAGPTVQIRSASGRVDLFNDEDGEVAWDGPLAVMVNRLSASASEIFAGAIQDYQRGLIIGGQTFGKGTVQTLIPLNRGQLKMTQAKFYRVSGQSTQHQGVIPDIEFPEIYDHDEIGESTLEDALPWDVIRPTRFRRSPSFAPLLSMLESRHEARVADDPEFTYLKALLAKSREHADDKEISLSESERRKEQKEDEDWRLALENRRRVALGEKPVSSMDELEKIAAVEDAAVAQGEPLAGPVDVDDDADAASADAASADAASPDAAAGTKAKQSEPADDAADDGMDDAAVADADADADAEKKPDALLVESGNILLDYITLSHSVAELDDPDGAQPQRATN